MHAQETFPAPPVIWVGFVCNLWAYGVVDCPTGTNMDGMT
jgi:hypothetical protein